MPMSVAPVIQRPADQEQAGADADRVQIDHEAGPEERTCHDGDRERVSECNGKRGEPYHAPVVAMKSQRDREQPAHRRIETMKCPKAGEREPWPELGGDRVHGSLFRFIAAAACGVRALAAADSDLAASCVRACSRRTMSGRALFGHG